LGGSSSLGRRHPHVLASLALGILAVGAGFGAYAFGGWRDAASDAAALKADAQRLIANGHGPGDLGAGRLALLVRVEDPNFWSHNGVDFATPGAGATTITQSLSKRLAFKDFRKGLPKIRQTAYAISLENHLSKDEILALALDRAQMGRGPAGGERVTGFFRASQAFFGAPPRMVAEDEFVALIAVLIAPDALSLAAPGKALDGRIRRIKALAEGACAPASHDDVWLEGCAATP
jgi:hypothetical protein